MIKNASFYQVTTAPDLNDMPVFTPTMPTQELSVGWVPPNGGDLYERISGATVLSLCIETRKVPADILQKEIDKQCKAIEAETGRKPGKAQKRQLKEEALQTLLPKAFPKQVHVPIIIDGQRLIIGATGAVVDHALTALVLLSAELQSIDAATSPSAYMSSLLLETHTSSDFLVGLECELKSEDAKVRYTKHPLLIPEVADHIKRGKIPTSLELIADGMCFTLTDKMEAKKIEFEAEQAIMNAESGFETDMTIAILTLRNMLRNLEAELS